MMLPYIGKWHSTKYPEGMSYGSCSIELPLTHQDLETDTLKFKEEVHSKMIFKYEGKYRNGEEEEFMVTITPDAKISVIRLILGNKEIPTCTIWQRFEMEFTGLKDRDILGKYVSHLPEDEGVFTLYSDPSILEELVFEYQITS